MIDPSILIGFLPWIVFAIVSGFFGIKIGSLIGLALQIAFFIPTARKRTYTIIEAFSGGLAFITWATIVIGDPFTIQYTKRTTPKEWWTSELFLSSNLSIALGWAVAFLGATVVSIIGALSGFKFLFILSLAIGCMLLAIIWHKRVLDETMAKAKVLSKS